MKNRVLDRVVYVKSRKRKIMRIVREQYLRNDIVAEVKDLTKRAVERDSNSTYAVVDTQITKDYLELLESYELKNIIFPQTVARELKENSSSAYNRLRKITNDDRRNSFIFDNETFVVTHTEKLPHEANEDRNRRALITMTKWLSENTDASIVLITNNDETKKSALQSGLQATDLKEFLNLFYPSNTNLHELMASLDLVLEEKAKAITTLQESSQLSSSSSSSTIDPTTGYMQYKPLDLLEIGVKSNQFYRGKLEVKKSEPDTAFVMLPEKLSIGNQIYIPTVMMRNRAIHGDIVAVQLLDEKEWKDAKVKNAQVKTKTPTGFIVGIFTNNWRPYVCTLQLDDNSNTQQYALAVPWDYRIPKIRIKTRQINQLKNKRIIVRVDEWPMSSNYPSGHYVSALGEILDRDTEISLLLSENSIATTQFTKNMLADLPAHTPENPWKPSEKDIKNRRDIRSWRVMSIDPIGSQDIDDALSVEKLPNGLYRIGCHIADVTHFVREGSLLDVEARSRGTSVYLSDRRIDMLPALLSEKLCSLREKQDRFAVSVVWDIHPNTGNVVNTWFGRTVMHSIHELNYEQAQKIMDDEGGDRKTFGDTEYNAIKTDLNMLLKVYRVLRDKRLKAGALELESFEVKFVLNDKKDPTAVKPKHELEIMKMVAEYMILANCSVAKKIHEHFPSCALLRRHPFPRLDAFSDLKSAGSTLGIDIDVTSNINLSKSLSKACFTDESVVKLLKSFATIAMAEAEYFSTGGFEVNEFYHYGLAAEYYTHFTSPIRRYADCIVHRQLLLALNDPQTINYQKPSHLSLQDIADHINGRNRAAKSVQRSSTELFHVLYFKGKEITADGLIYKMKENGFSVFLPDYSFKGTLYLRDSSGKLQIPDNALSLNPEKYKSSVKVEDCKFDSATQEMILHTPAGRISVKLFDRVTVKVTTTDSRAHLPQVKLELVHFGLHTKLKKIEVAPIVEPTITEEPPPTSTTDKKKKKIQSEDFSQNVDKINCLYNIFDSYGGGFSICDPSTITINPKQKWVKTGRRTFKEKELLQDIETQRIRREEEQYYNNEEREEEYSNNESYRNPSIPASIQQTTLPSPIIVPQEQDIKQKFGSQIAEAEKKVKIKIVKKIKVIKKTKQ
eukprot:TRINITY_DN3156_c0_g3_i1.p1 TRINITY_DN3156_c0_g3~~TRINITY_DN3156_c0_g3_i1.p1  ORF type:complete len:1138 (-),score=238.79 TRINITY_DN3156_c0_g3_i1:21-3404(-)